MKKSETFRQIQNLKEDTILKLNSYAFDILKRRMTFIKELRSWGDCGWYGSEELYRYGSKYFVLHEQINADDENYFSIKAA